MFLLNVTRLEQRLFEFFRKISEVKRGINESKEFQKLLEIEIEDGYKTYEEDSKLASFDLASIDKLE